jgi:hypothetical protein
VNILNFYVFIFIATAESICASSIRFIVGYTVSEKVYMSDKLGLYPPNDGRDSMALVSRR